MEAAQVYDSALIFKKGIKAKLNFPGEVPRPLSDVLKARMIADSKGKGKKVISPDKEEAVEEALRPEEEEEGEPAVLSGDISKSNLTTIAGQATPGSKAEKKNGIRVMMKVVYELFGPTVKLPLQVQVECDGEERQLVWLKRKADRYAAFFFNEPLRSKVKASHPHHRKWAMRREEGSDVPILSIQLRLQRDGTEKFLGVIQNRGLASGKFIAKAYVRGRPINIGCFSAAPDAARAYDAAARFLKGAEAMLNFPHEDPVLPNEEVKAKLLAASRLPPKGKRPNKVHNLEDDENEMLELVNEEDGEPVRYEDEDEDKDEEEDPYYSNVKRRRSAHNDPPVEIQEGDEDLASRAAAIALMSLLQ